MPFDQPILSDTARHHLDVPETAASSAPCIAPRATPLTALPRTLFRAWFGALLSALPCLPLAAQAGGWESVHQSSTWLTVTVDEAVSRRAAFWFDGQWRRMGLGAEPQQLLLRPGVQWTLTPGVRVATGYAYIATAPYGEVPSATPLREHRLWQQLALSHRAGRVTISHRYRWEQRWLAPVVGDETQTFQYQQRARYMIRAQTALGGLARAGQPVIAFVYDEMLLPVGHGTATGRLAQNRASVGVGIPLDARHRLEVGYLNLWNALSAAQTNEFNHTLTIGLVRTVTR